MISEIFYLSETQSLLQVFCTFILIVTVFWGILSVMGFFSKRTNLIISIGVALLLSTSNLFLVIQRYLLLSNLIAVISFFLLFIVGVMVFSARRGAEISFKTLEGLYKKREKLIKEREKIYNKFIKAKKDTDKKALFNQLVDIDEKIKLVDMEILHKRGKELI